MQRTVFLCIGVSAGMLSPSLAAEPASRPARLSIFQRLTAAQLERFDRDRAALAAQIKMIDVPYPFVRGTFHMHTELSHDSRGKVAEVIAAAKATGTRVVGFTEHPSQKTDVIAANVKGWRDGVYFLAGVEAENALYWPGREGEGAPNRTTTRLETPADLRFVSHPEEVRAFDRSRFAGMEIYNTHSDAKDEPTKQLLAAMIFNLAAVRAHPEAAFESFLDYPASFLARFDRLTQEGPFAGIAANDSHQNQGLTVIANPDGSAEVLDATSDVIWRGDGLKAAMLLAAFGQTTRPAAPTVLSRFQLDPYEISMRHIGTFLQIGEGVPKGGILRLGSPITEKSVRHALRTGRIVVGFEIIAPLPAFGVWVESGGEPVATVGDQLPWRRGLTLRAALPLAARVRIVHNGVPIDQQHTSTYTRNEIGAGVYRVEAFQTLAGEEWPWVISNPIYILAPDNGHRATTRD